MWSECVRHRCARQHAHRQTSWFMVRRCVTIYCLFTTLLCLLKFHALYFLIVFLYFVVCSYSQGCNCRDFCSDLLLFLLSLLWCLNSRTVSRIVLEFRIIRYLLFLYKCIYRILQFDYQTSNTVILLLYYSVIYRPVRAGKNLVP